MKRPWTDEDKAVIQAEYVTADLVKLAKRLNRTVAAVKRYAQSKGIKRPRHSTKGYTYTQRNPRPRKAKEVPALLIQQAIRGWHDTQAR